MKKRLAILAIIVLSLTLLSSCDGISNNKKQKDMLGAIPNHVLNYEGDLDVFIYLDGYSGTMIDIGHKNYEAMDLYDPVFAKFYATAKEFNKYAPGVKINLYWCEIHNYNQQIAMYTEQRGHIPHLMHATEHVNEMISIGYATDLSIYEDSSYYDIFDETIMNEFNFGGFQGAIPFMVFPMGVFVNSDLLEKQYIEYNDEYVKNFTMNNFMDSIKTTTNSEQTGLSRPIEWLVSLSAPSIYQSFVYEKKVELDTPLIRELLEMEKEMIKYTAFDIKNGGLVKKDSYNVNFSETLYNFIRDEFYTFAPEMPWHLNAASVLATELEKEEKFDLLPYPKANDETDAHVGMLAEGLIVGNQCPIVGESCGQDATTIRDVAAYFAMFMNADPRAIKAKNEVKYTDVNRQNIYTGILDFPMVKRNFFYDWKDEIDSSGISPESEVFSYQLGLYLENYTMLWNKTSDSEKPDVKDYTNLKPGFRKVLEIFYDEPYNRINFYGRPDNVPSGSYGTTKNILEDWQTRIYGEDGENDLNSSNYTGWVESKLKLWENEINNNIEICYAYLQEQINYYYGEDLYFQY